jgi:fucose permease
VTPHAAIYAALFIAGIATTMLGPLLPLVQSLWRLDDASAGLLFAAQFAGSVCASAAVGWLARGAGYFALLAPGLLLIAAGAMGLAIAGWPAAFLFVACYGVGLGLVIPAGNLGLAAMHPGASARPLALLNLSWCGGAVLAPVLVAAVPLAFLPVVAVSSGALAAAAYVLLRRTVFRPESVDRARGEHAGFMVAVILFLYVGTENAISGWIPVRAFRGFGDNEMWSALPSLFWIAMLAGRALTPELVRRVKVHVVLNASLLVALAGTGLIVVAPAATWLFVAIVVAGIGLAPVFPLTVSRYADAQGSNSTSGLIFTMASLGGAVLPPLVGYVSRQSGDIRTGMSLALLSICLVLWLQFRLSRMLRGRVDAARGATAA